MSSRNGSERRLRPRSVPRQSRSDWFSGLPAISLRSPGRVAVGSTNLIWHSSLWTLKKSDHRRILYGFLYWRNGEDLSGTASRICGWTRGRSHCGDNRQNQLRSFDDANHRRTVRKNTTGNASPIVYASQPERHDRQSDELWRDHHGNPSSRPQWRPRQCCPWN